MKATDVADWSLGVGGAAWARGGCVDAGCGRRVAAGGLLGLVVVFGLSGCRSEDAGGSAVVPEPLVAAVIGVAEEKLAVHEQVVGTVAPQLQAVVSAKVTGRITEMLAVPGMSVAAGEVLARIEAPQLEAGLARAEAALANAVAEAERFRALRDTGSVSQRDIDRVETALRMAQAERDQIRSQLDESMVVAPFAGRITRKHHDTGDLVLPGTPVCRIEDPSRLRFEMHVAESLAGGIVPGAVYAVEIEAAGCAGPGTVAEISPAADAGSRTFLVKLDLPTNDRLLAGQFGRALLPRGDKRAVLVPRAALLERGQLVFVAVVGEDQVARLRIVRTGAATGERVEILAGLDDGERILAEVPGGFVSGTPVRPPA